MATDKPQYALIAGSGFKSFGRDAILHDVNTEYGTPSCAVRELDFDSRKVFLLGRHGEELQIPAHEVNYRANLAALKALGTTQIIALNTVGVITPRQYPGQLAVPAQIIDYTWGRAHTIHNKDSANLEHIEFTEPFCDSLRQSLLAAANGAELECHDGGVHAVTQGPRLETAAEIDRLERDGVDYVGMTAMPEAALAQELGMRYACLSLIVNYAAGRGEQAIHADIEASTMKAKMQAMKILHEFFSETSAND